MTSKDTSGPIDALSTIYNWSKDRPTWQRDALRRIILNGCLSEMDIDELVSICRGSPTLSAEPLERHHFVGAISNGKSVAIASISNASGVNNIAPEQALHFSKTGINIVYGDNGTGKSGYARIFKRACRARRAGEILPNVYAAQQHGPATAKISFSQDGEEDVCLDWEDNQSPDQVLSQISVFDSDCAAVHVEGKNEVAFKPFGLDVPDELARASQIIRDRLIKQKSALDAQRDRIFSRPVWSRDTAAGKAIQDLSWKTTIDSFSKIADFSEAELERLASLENDLNKDPRIAETQQRLRLQNARSLLEILESKNKSNSDESISNVKQAHLNAVGLQKMADIAAAETFTVGHLPQTGSLQWRVLWEASRDFAVAIGSGVTAFPPSVGEKCLLCQTDLDEVSATRIALFHKFVETAAENHAAEAREVYAQLYRAFRLSNLDWKNVSVYVRDISITKPNLGKDLRRFVAYIRLKRYLLDRSILDRSPLRLPNRSTRVLIDLKSHIADLQKYAAELRAALDPEGRIKLQKEYLQLRDRRIIRENIGAISDEIQRLRDIEAIDRAITTTTTNAVTKLGNDIADKVITPQLRDRFQSEIVRIAGEKVRVEIVRSGGRYGSPQYQIRLFARPAAHVGDILSEGEQTCVAVAAFFAELATAEHKSALVFDDPVTSLDHRWRKQVARRLIDEAADRQIIVFAHDLVFVNDLIDYAKEVDLKPKIMSVSRGAAGTGIVSNGLPWKAQGVPERVDNLEKQARAAKVLYEQDEDAAYAFEIANLYEFLRAAWERALEDGAFSKVIIRHRDYVNTKDLKKVSVLTEQDCETFSLCYKKCCDVVNAHDPSRVRNADPPTPSDAMSDVAKLKDWYSSIKKRQNAIKL